MFGINGAEFVILALLALVLLGPEKLPGYARQLARWIKAARALFATARDRVSEELGGEEILRDLADFDPGSLSPAEILRQATRPPGPPRPSDTAVHWDSEAT